MVKVKGNAQSDIPVHEMKCGQVGVITKWAFSSYVGRVVQRYGDALITLGACRGQAFSNVLSDRETGNRVRILEPGTELVIE